jgi:hypothetical protein
MKAIAFVAYFYSIGERFLGAIGPEAIKIFSRIRPYSNKNTYLLTAIVCYDYMVKETAMEIGGKTRFNLNEELIDLGYCRNRPSATAWKPFELPRKNEFLGKVTWVNIEGESKILLVFHMSSETINLFHCAVKF